MVSAIITTYKREPGMVKKAIESVLSQTYSDFELIIADDSPPDFPGRSAVKKMIEDIADERIRYIQHETNKGACAARNTGIQNAKGEYIAFLDDDDIWLPRKLETQLEGFADGQTGLVYCNYNVINEATGKVTVINNDYLARRNIMDQLLINNTLGIFPMVRKSCLEECGMFDTTLKSSQDLDMWLRVIEKYDTGYANAVLASCYIHEGEQISSNPEKKLQATEILNKRYEARLRANSKLGGIRTMQMGLFYSMAGDVKKAASCWLKAVRICPSNVYYNLKFLASMIKNFKKGKVY